MPITPIGIETFLINSPFGLFHLSRITSTGSFNLEIFFIDKHIFSNFFLFNFNLLIKFFFIFFYMQILYL